MKTAEQGRALYHGGWLGNGVVGEGTNRLKDGQCMTLRIGPLSKRQCEQDDQEALEENDRETAANNIETD